MTVIEKEASDLHLKVPAPPIIRQYGQLVPIEGSEPQPDETASLTLRNEALSRALGMLGERERRVLELRFGLNGEAPRTLDEV